MADFPALSLLSEIEDVSMLECGKVGGGEFEVLSVAGGGEVEADLPSVGVECGLPSVGVEADLLTLDSGGVLLGDPLLNLLELNEILELESAPRSPGAETLMPVSLTAPRPLAAPSLAPVAPTSSSPIQEPLTAPSLAPLAPSSSSPLQEPPTAPSLAPVAPSSSSPLQEPLTAPSLAPVAPSSSSPLQEPLTAPSLAPVAPSSSSPLQEPLAATSLAPVAPSSSSVPQEQLVGPKSVQPSRTLPAAPASAEQHNPHSKVSPVEKQVPRLERCSREVRKGPTSAVKIIIKTTRTPVNKMVAPLCLQQPARSLVKIPRAATQVPEVSRGQVLRSGGKLGPRVVRAAVDPVLPQPPSPGSRAEQGGKPTLRRKRKVYELEQQQDPQLERCRRNAINARKNRELKKAQLATLERRVEDVSRERDELAGENQSLREAKQQLEQQVQHLNNVLRNQSKLSSLISKLSPASVALTHLSPTDTQASA